MTINKFNNSLTNIPGKSTPDISIIVPVYNTEKFIDKCLIALRNQTHKNIEIIVINDGSTDNSKEIIETHQQEDHRIKLFNQNNSGPATSRNLGISNAVGRYVMFCDSDDWFELNMCELMLNKITTENVDLVMCDSIFHFEDGHNRTTGDIESHQLKTIGRINLVDTNRADIFVVLWNKIFKNELIKKYQIRFPDGYEFDDNSFLYQYLSISNCVFGFEKKLYNYKFRPGTLMANLDHNKKYIHNIKSLEHTLNFILSNDVKNNWNFISKICHKQLYWVSRELNEQSRLMFWNKFKMDIIPKLPEKIILSSMVLSAIEKSDFNLVDKIILQNSNVIKKSLYNITYYKKVSSYNKTKYYLFGLQIFKTTLYPNIKKYYFLGILFFLSKF